MAITLSGALPSPAHVDSNYVSYEVGYVAQLVSGQVSTASDTSAYFSLPYIGVTAKARLILEITAISGSSAGLAVAFAESIDGVGYNSTAVATIASQVATGTYWSSAVSGPIFNGGQIASTVVGTTPSITWNLYLAVWNK